MKIDELSMVDKFYILMALENFMDKKMSIKDQNYIEGLKYRFLITYKDRKHGIIRYLDQPSS